MNLVEQGVSTGSKMLDRMLLQGRDAVLTTENVYYVPYVPTPEEHFYRQDPGEAGMLFRPNLMIHMEDDQFSIEVLDALVELGRNVLGGLQGRLLHHALLWYCALQAICPTPVGLEHYWSIANW